MAIVFPSNPSLNQQYSYAGRTWSWNGTAWQSVGTANITLPDIVPLDNLQYEFDGIQSRFYPKNNGVVQAITNPFTLLLSLNGIIQNVSFPEVVWGTPFSYDGFTIDSDGYIAFSEVPPAGSTFNARIMAGPVTQSSTNTYPFKAMDILLGAN
jgi:hypothetical protein